MKLYIEQKKTEGIKLLLHKSLLLVLLVGVVGSFIGCASHQDDGYYERANKASEKALEKLDRE
jgi:hypothetical protein